MSICPKHCISIGEAGCPLCARKVKKPKFGEVRKPLKQSTERPTRMSADVEVQADLVNADLCLLLGFTDGDCSGRVERCHIVSQQLIRDVYPKGAYRPYGEEFWIPITRHTIFPKDGAFEKVTLQEILDDNANLVNGCAGHNIDGQAMVDALDRRRVAGLVSYPNGFGEFTHSYRFECNGGWYYRKLEVAA